MKTTTPFISTILAAFICLPFFTQANALVLTATITSSTNVLCNGGNTGTATVTAAGGTAPYTYSWSPSGGINSTATGLTAGTYTVTVTDAVFATATASVIITQPPALLLNASIVSNIPCNNGTGCAVANVSGGTPPYTYLWVPAGCTNQTCCFLSAGFYTVAVTDFNGCSATTTITLTQPPPLTAAITGITNNTSCSSPNGTITLTVAGGTGVYTYSWSPSGQSTSTATGLFAGTYTCTVMDMNGCTATASGVVLGTGGPSLSVITVPATFFCNGSATVTATGGTSPYTYSWVPGGSTNSTDIGLCAGYYCVYVTDAIGCTSTQCDSVTATYTTTTGCGSYSPDLCYVTSDTNSQHNILYWQRTGLDTNVIDSFLIYRGVTTSTYAIIAEQSVHAHTVYTDITSNVNITSYYYKLGLHDTCNNITESSYHESIMLQASLGIGNTMNLIWNYYIGAGVNYYRILRDDSGTGNWHVLDSVPGGVNQYTDLAAPVNPNLRYRINVNWNVSCSPFLIHLHSFSLNYPNGEWSNITNLHVVGIEPISLLSSEIDVYPNPVKDYVEISFQSPLTGTMVLSNDLGQKLYEEKISQNLNKEKIDLNAFPSGVYILSIETTQGRFVKKIVKI